MHYVSPDHRVVVFDGADALAFLQSQFTNDVAALAIGQWQWQGYCSAKGRLHATFALVRLAETAYAAIVHESVAAFVVKRLSMFRLRSKVAISVDEQLSVVHHFEAPGSADGRRAMLELGHGRWVTLDESIHIQSSDASPDSMRRWAEIGIKAKQPEIVNQTNELFVPQMIGWDTVTPGGGVSFSKGCYPGQEVVARAHYRGAVKRRLAEQSVPIDAAPGATFTRTDGVEVDVINVARVTGDQSAVALVVEPIVSA